MGTKFSKQWRIIETKYEVFKVTKSVKNFLMKRGIYIELGKAKRKKKVIEDKTELELSKL